jgi:hypothetical protein
MWRNDYDRKGSIKKISGHDPIEAWRQEEQIGGKPLVVKNLWLWFWLWPYRATVKEINSPAYF